jgi:hypothetical protein
MMMMMMMMMDGKVLELGIELVTWRWSSLPSCRRSTVGPRKNWNPYHENLDSAVRGWNNSASAELFRQHGRLSAPRGLCFIHRHRTGGGSHFTSTPCTLGWLTTSS